MYIHAFAFRWIPGVTDEQKERVKSEILALQGKIPGLLETHVGTNVSPRGQGHEFGGVMKFVDREALHAYFPHPIHSALGEWLMPLIEPLEMDFEAASSVEPCKTE
jgi:Stress responsive A/B Barrel Domain